MVSKGNIKFLKIFLKGKTTEYLVLFIWKIAFETLVICEVESALWEEILLYDFRQICQCHYTERFLSLSFEVPTLLSPRLYSPVFSGCEINTQSCETLIPKIQQVMFWTFFSYSINILTNYSIFLNLSHFTISRNLFLVISYSDSKPLKIQCFWFSLINQVCFRTCNSEVLFFVLACYCPQLITQKQIVVINNN